MGCCTNFPIFLPGDHRLLVVLDKRLPHPNCFCVCWTRRLRVNFDFSTLRQAFVRVRFAVFAADRLRDFRALALFACATKYLQLGACVSVSVSVYVSVSYMSVYVLV